MYVYKVGYSSWEESPHRYLVHELKFEEDEFLQMVCGALESVVLQELEKPIDNYSPIRNFSDAFPDPIAEFLIKEKGFINLQVCATVSVSGWDNLHPDLMTGMWERSSRSEATEQPDLTLSLRLTEANLIPRIAAKNEEFERWLNAEFNRTE